MHDSAYNISVVRRHRPHDQGLQGHYLAFEAGRLETASEENVTDETNDSPRLVGPRSIETQQYVPKLKHLFARIMRRQHHHAPWRVTRQRHDPTDRHGPVLDPDPDSDVGLYKRRDGGIAHP